MRLPTRVSIAVSLTLFAGCDGPRSAEPPERASEGVFAPTPADPAPEPTEPAAPEPAVEPAPEPEPEPEPPPRVSYGHADLDLANDSVIGPPDPLPDCEARLAAAGVSFKPARIGVGREVDGHYTCGAHQVVRFKRGPGDIRYANSSPLLTCTMALAFADFERIAQEEAERIIGARIVSIDHIGTYNCREMVNYDMLSEHSFANAIDLKQFNFADGSSANVLDHFQPAVDPATDPRTLFLRALANRLYDEEVFSVVVTPYFDNLHRNHIHVDLARYRVDGSRP
jgi:hypothetical protein